VTDVGTELGRARREDIMGFEDWAALSARLLRRTEAERSRILEEERMTPEEWAKLDVRFGRELVADLAEGDLVRAHRYGAICAEELAGRGVAAHETEPPPPMPPHGEPIARAHDTGPPPPPMVYAQPIARAHDTGPPPPMVYAQPIAGTHDTDRPPPTPRFQEYLASAPHPSPHDGGTSMIPRYGPPPVDRTPELTVEQYAALCVASAMFPDRALAVLHQFGVIDVAAHRELNEEWRAKMGHDGGLQDQWIRLCEHYREYYGKWPEAQP